MSEARLWSTLLVTVAFILGGVSPHIPCPMQTACAPNSTVGAYHNTCKHPGCQHGCTPSTCLLHRDQYKSSEPCTCYRLTQQEGVVGSLPSWNDANSSAAVYSDVSLTAYPLPSESAKLHKDYLSPPPHTPPRLLS